jgi:hypothetical protein
MAQRLVILPVEISVGDDTLWSGGCVVHFRKGEILMWRGRIVPESELEIPTRE